MRYDGVIFDFDGVLLDSGFDGFEWAKKVRKKKTVEMGYSKGSIGGREFIFEASSFEELQEMVDGTPFTMEEYVEMEKAVAERKVEMVRDGEMELVPGARSLLEELDLPMAVVSNAYGNYTDKIIKATGLDSCLEFWTAPSLEEIERYHSITKPEVHMLEEAMDRLKVSNPLMAGDSSTDIRAAKNLGIDAVFVESYRKEVEADPDHRVSDIRQLREIVRSSQR